MTRRGHTTLRRLRPWLAACALLLFASGLTALQVFSSDRPELFIVVTCLVVVVALIVALGPAVTIWQSRLLDRLREQHPDAWVFPFQSSPRFGTTIAAIGLPDLRTPLLGVAVVDADSVELWSGWARPKRRAKVCWRSIAAVEATEPLHLLWATARSVQFHLRHGDVVVPLALGPLSDDWRLFLSVPTDPRPIVDGILRERWPSATSLGAHRWSEFPGDDQLFLSGQAEH